MTPEESEIIQKSIEYRGTILAGCTALEKEIENILCEYFSSDSAKQIDLLLMVLDRMTFDSKIAVLDLILRKIFPETFDKKYKKLIAELRSIKDDRNVMAHHVVDIFDGHGTLKQGVGFINYRNSPTIETYNSGRYSLIMNRIEKSVDFLRGIKLS
jgi:hypothetical protein